MLRSMCPPSGHGILSFLWTEPGTELPVTAPTPQRFPLTCSPFADSTRPHTRISVCLSHTGRILQGFVRERLHLKTEQHRLPVTTCLWAVRARQSDGFPAGNVSGSLELSRALPFARAVLNGILASQADEETRRDDSCTLSDPRAWAMLGPALSHPGAGVLAPKVTRRRKSKDNKRAAWF